MKNLKFHNVGSLNFGGAVAFRNNGTISHVTVDASSLRRGNSTDGLGGICGENNSTGIITNCAVVNSSIYHQWGNNDIRNVAFITEKNNGTVSNCLSYNNTSRESELAHTGVIVYSGNAPVNSYYYITTAITGNTQGTVLTADQCVSGQTARLLNGGNGTAESASGAWGQTIGKDKYPVLGGPAVYKVTYDANGGTSTMDAQYLNSGQALTANAFTRTGYNFAGWNTQANGSGTSYTDGQKVINLTATNNGTMTLYAQWTLAPVPVTYLDANGVQQQCTNYTILASNMNNLGTNGQETWYVIDDNLTFNNTIYVQNGNVHIILKDNVVMNVGTEQGYINDNGIHVSNNKSLSIYAQSTGAAKGQLNVYATDYGIYAYNGALNIYGGQVTATGTNHYGIYAYLNATVNINGGQVTANGTTGISAYIINNGTFTLGWTNPTDFIYANRYFAYGTTINIAEGKAFITDDGTIYTSGALTSEQLDAIAGKTLRPYSSSKLYLADNADNTAIIGKFDGKGYDVTLAGRTLYKDRAWNTLCLPFALTLSGSVLDGDNVDVRTLNSSDFDSTKGELTLTFTDKGAVTELEAGKPYIIKWDGDGTANLVNPTFTAVTISSSDAGTVHTNYADFVGTYGPTDIYTADRTNLYLGDANTLHYPWADGMEHYYVNAFRAYFALKNGLKASPNPSEGGEPVRAFVLNFGDGEASGIATTNYTNYTNDAGAWYDLQGRKIENRKSVNRQLRKGLYIHGGRKVVVK